MAYNAALDTVYNHYLTTYAPKSSSQYDAHKKSELRGIYNNIVKQYKESPLYLLNNSKETQEFAVSLKESSKELRNVIASLGGVDQSTLLNQKVAFSSNSSIVDATFIGSDMVDTESDEIPSFDIEVISLASPQENLGNYLVSSQTPTLAPDTYSFDVAINDINYEFQFSINEKDNNKIVQERLARLISNANIGLKTDVIESENGKSALRLTSQSTGLNLIKGEIFSISDDQTSKAPGSVSYFGLNHTSRPASNAEFILNGEKRGASSNHFMVEKLYKLSLRGVSPENEVTTIGVKTDMESLAENIATFVDGYNSFIDSVSSDAPDQTQGNRLLREMTSLSLYYEEPLADLGLTIQEDGRIQSDLSVLHSLTFDENKDENLNTIKNFTNNVLRKTNKIFFDPMNYVDKKIVAYKNPNRNFTNPYITSAYSGMMFNGYC